jgi:hypothetical protein
MLHKQEGNYKVYKLTNYKSNYTSTICMKVNISLCMGNAYQREE